MIRLKLQPSSPNLPKLPLPSSPKPQTPDLSATGSRKSSRVGERRVLIHLYSLRLDVCFLHVFACMRRTDSRHGRRRPAPEPPKPYTAFSAIGVAQGRWTTATTAAKVGERDLRRRRTANPHGSVCVTPLRRRVRMKTLMKMITRRDRSG